MDFVISINMKEIDNNDIISVELIGLFARQNKGGVNFFCLRYFDKKVRQRFGTLRFNLPRIKTDVNLGITDESLTVIQSSAAVSTCMLNRISPFGDVAGIMRNLRAIVRIAPPCEGGKARRRLLIDTVSSPCQAREWGSGAGFPDVFERVEKCQAAGRHLCF